ncbi:MAG: Gas vesicle synthesis GvpLGvpF [Gemmatimonadetes bacterium]|nr:Gas vesicle synthesis GvpLGvpF [Gemmatimonadota bacterium]
MALNLYGVTFHETHEVRLPVPNTRLVVVRDLTAICGESEYRALDATPERVEQYTGIVTAFAARGAVLPAPVGVVFRSHEAVERWLELHYIALSDALSFVDNRVVGRVHIRRPGASETGEAGSDVTAAAAESLRAVRRAAVATVPLRIESEPGIVLSAAYLVEQGLWDEFARAVQEQDAAAPNLRFELTGPWPPYDFVQMQLGA